MVEREWRGQRLAAKQSNDKEGGKGSLIIVGRRDQDKFFSNGESHSFVWLRALFKDGYRSWLRELSEGSQFLPMSVDRLYTVWLLTIESSDNESDVAKITYVPKSV